MCKDDLRPNVYLCSLVSEELCQYKTGAIMYTNMRRRC